MAQSMANTFWRLVLCHYSSTIAALWHWLITHLQTSKWRSWTSGLLVTHLRSSWKPQPQMPRANPHSHCPLWKRRPHWMTLKRKWKLQKRDARYFSTVTQLWSFRTWVQDLGSKCNRLTFVVLSEPRGRSAETPGGETRAREGGDPEGRGRGLQLAQAGARETQSKDGGKQREPYCQDGSPQWEIQGEGEPSTACQRMSRLMVK